MAGAMRDAKGGEMRLTEERVKHFQRWLSDTAVNVQRIHRNFWMDNMDDFCADWLDWSAKVETLEYAAIQSDIAREFWNEGRAKVEAENAALRKAMRDFLVAMNGCISPTQRARIAGHWVVLNELIADLDTEKGKE
jgi:hypothetical protein